MSDDLINIANNKNHKVEKIIELKKIFDLSEEDKIILKNNVQVQLSKIENLNLRDFLLQLN